jgi:predicted nucleotidyltransferase component of viral defense system
VKISKERLLQESEATGFRLEIIERVFHLLHLLESLYSHPFLKERLALKGGTALNLFIFDLPRLSVDIDLNYIGSHQLEVMFKERPKIEEALRAVCSREGFAVRRFPVEHAGGKWSLRYESAIGKGGDLEIDLNFMFRTPLWPVAMKDSKTIGSYKIRQIPVLDTHEIAGGKLTALLARHAVRDLFDAHQLLTKGGLARERLRLAFVVYGAVNRKDWRTVSVDDLRFDAGEIENQLLPLLRRESLPNIDRSAEWARQLVEECKDSLTVVLPFSESEREFLNRLLDRGEIDSSLLTSNEDLAQRIKKHPLIEWKAINVRQYKKILD